MWLQSDGSRAELLLGPDEADVHHGSCIPRPVPRLRFLEQLEAAWTSLSARPPLVTWASLQDGGP